MNIMQGDEYSIPVSITIDGNVADDSVLQDVEISIGKHTKSINGGGVAYDSEKQCFLFHVTQEETFDLISTPQKSQVRIKMNDGTVRGVSLGTVDVTASLSKEII